MLHLTTTIYNGLLVSTICRNQFLLVGAIHSPDNVLVPPSFG